MPGRVSVDSEARSKAMSVHLWIDTPPFPVRLFVEFDTWVHLPGLRVLRATIEENMVILA